MGQVIVEFGKATAPSRFGGAAQVYNPGGQSEEVTSSGTSAQTTMTANKDDIAIVTNNGGTMIWVKFGENPTAAVEDMHAVAANQRRDFGPMGENFKAAVIDDS